MREYSERINEILEDKKRLEEIENTKNMALKIGGTDNSKLNDSQIKGKQRRLQSLGQKIEKLTKENKGKTEELRKEMEESVREQMSSYKPKEEIERGIEENQKMLNKYHGIVQRQNEKLEELEKQVQDMNSKLKENRTSKFLSLQRQIQISQYNIKTMTPKINEYNQKIKDLENCKILEEHQEEYRDLKATLNRITTNFDLEAEAQKIQQMEKNEEDLEQDQTQKPENKQSSKPESFAQKPENSAVEENESEVPSQEEEVPLPELTEQEKIEKIVIELNDEECALIEELMQKKTEENMDDLQFAQYITENLTQQQKENIDKIAEKIEDEFGEQTPMNVFQITEKLAKGIKEYYFDESEREEEEPESDEEETEKPESEANLRTEKKMKKIFKRTLLKLEKDDVELIEKLYQEMKEKKIPDKEQFKYIYPKMGDKWETIRSSVEKKMGSLIFSSELMEGLHAAKVEQDEKTKKNVASEQEQQDSRETSENAESSSQNQENANATSKTSQPELGLSPIGGLGLSLSTSRIGRFFARIGKALSKLWKKIGKKSAHNSDLQAEVENMPAQTDELARYVIENERGQIEEGARQAQARSEAETREQEPDIEMVDL